MSSGWLGHRRFRLDAAHHSAADASSREPVMPDLPEIDDEPLSAQSLRLQGAITRTRDYLLGRQSLEGYWVGELEGDTILESEYILLLTYAGRGQTERARHCANYILQRQMPEGGWNIYPGGPLEISASVKAYLALKIAGHSPDEPEMVRACAAIRAAGGAERVNSFTRYYLALLGVISYDKCPAVPPELILLPNWFPINVYEMSSWSRTIVIPLSLLWAFRPLHRLPDEHNIRELFLASPEELPTAMGQANIDPLKSRTWIDWTKFFRRVDAGLKLCERWRLLPFRKRAIRKAAEWMQQRFESSDGLGAIFPPIVWSIIGLKCLGHDDDSPDVKRAWNELEKLCIHDRDLVRQCETVRLEPCRSPVWDTAIATIALREAGVPSGHSSIRSAVSWLLSKEAQQLGDWAVGLQNPEVGGWYFEFNNEFYPDIDDTMMVVMALTRSLPDGEPTKWRAEYLFGAGRGLPEGEVAAVVGRRSDNPEVAIADIESMRPVLKAVARGSRWITAMQNSDGGWGAFDRDNDREILTRVPFADHNAMIDPSTADLTSRALEMYSGLGMTMSHPVAQRALSYIWKEQEADHCWFGRWGVNYLYGTWQTLVGLTAIGVPSSDPRIRNAVTWLKTHQQDCGGWGETPETYDNPALRGTGTPTASQTAWAILGLLAAGEVHSAAVDAGIQYLLNTQGEDGTWDEAPYTGTGFPRVFYLKYELYRTYFPLMALARTMRLRHSRG